MQINKRLVIIDEVSKLFRQYMDDPSSAATHVLEDRSSESKYFAAILSRKFNRSVKETTVERALRQIRAKVKTAAETVKVVAA